MHRRPEASLEGWAAPAAGAFTSLTPTARRLLQAAHRVLERDGYEGLTLRRIAAEAGETKSLIIYHFENKAGLVAHLVDFLWHDADVALRHRVDRAQDDGRERLDALIDLHETLALDTTAYRLYFELLPRVAGDEETRGRVVEFYRAYRRFGATCVRSVAPEVEAAEPLAAALLAVGEGSPVQAMLLDEPVPTAAIFTLLRAVMGVHLGVGGQIGRGAIEVPISGAAAGGAREARDLSSRTGEAGPIADPADTLTPVGGDVLRGAVAVLKRDGLRALTLDAIAAQSGEPRSSVSYYLGDRRAMIARVLDLVNFETQTWLQEAARGSLDTPQAAQLRTKGEWVLRDDGGRRAFFELLPAVLRDPELKEREAAFVSWVLDGLAETFASAEPVPRRLALPLAAINLALVHGLSMQALVEPDTFEPIPALDAWFDAVGSWSAALAKVSRAD